MTNFSVSEQMLQSGRPDRSDRTGRLRSSVDPLVQMSLEGEGRPAADAAVHAVQLRSATGSVRLSLVGVVQRGREDDGAPAVPRHVQGGGGLHVPIECRDRKGLVQGERRSAATLLSQVRRYA